MEYQKINISKFKKYLNENELDLIYKEMLLALATQANEILQAIETEGFIIKEISREGNVRYKKNMLIDSLTSTYTTISRILKQNNLALQPQKVEEKKEEIEEPQPDSFQMLQNNLSKI